MIATARKTRPRQSVWCKPDTGMELARTDFDAHRDRQLDVDVGQRFRHLWIHRAAVRMAFSLSGLLRRRRRSR